MQTVKEDPKRRGLLVAGTELGVFVSFNDGDDWQSLQLNLPPISMRDLAFHDNDLIVATHGRGFWVLDDISALRQMTPTSPAADAHLFKPADAIILPPSTDDGTPTQKDEPEAENPPTGAIIDYYLKAAASGSGDDRDPERRRRRPSAATRAPIRCRRSIRTRSRSTRSGSARRIRRQRRPGMHRFVWDLRPTPPAGGRGGRGGGGGGGGGRGGLPPVAAGRLLGEADGERQDATRSR